MSHDPQEQTLTASEKQASAANVMIIAGEASGDLHGAGLVEAMRRMSPELRFRGIGGVRMEAAGVELLAHVSDMAIIGLKEVFPKLGFLRRIVKRLKALMDDWKPAMVILIDYPDFNLYVVARAAKKRNIKVFYYISPQVWAWRKGRVHQIKRLVDRMAVILPFEVDFYKAYGFEVHFVGHPLLDMATSAFTKPQLRQAFHLHENGPVVGLLPGSRMAEIEKLLGDMLEAARLIRERLPDAQFVLPLAQTLPRQAVESRVRASGVPVSIISDRTYDVIACCDLAVVTSGTATLETGLLGVPMVIIYKMPCLEYWIGSLVVDAQHIGLVNILANKTVAPELLQADACGARIAETALEILLDEPRKQTMINELAGIRKSLGEPGAATRAAVLACDLLKG